MAFDHRSLDGAEEVKPSDIAAMRAVDTWFPLLRLPETKQHGERRWSALANWRADRQIWRNAEVEAVSLRMSQLYHRAIKAGRDWQAYDIEANLIAWHDYALVTWPSDMPHAVTCDGVEFLCEGMEMQTYRPREFVAEAMGFEDPNGHLDTRKAWDWMVHVCKGGDPSDTPQERAEVDAPSVFKSAASFANVPVPERQWHVEGMIPHGTATLLAGDGGVGKSTLAFQLAVATAAGTQWIGRSVAQGPVIYLSAEDDEDELHRRLHCILSAEGLRYQDAQNLYVRSTVGHGALLAEKGRVGFKASALANEIERFALEIGAVLVVLDTLANLYPGDENDRAQVTQFVDIIKGIALRCDCTTLTLAHPSKSAMATGDGYSGSTAWNGAVRSRLYFERQLVQGECVDPDARSLTQPKNNYGPEDHSGLVLKYTAGIFVPASASEPLDRRAAATKAERVFIELLSLITSQGRKVNDSGGQTYAPNVFASHPKSEGVTRKAFRTAMETLLSDGRIRVSEDGPASKRRRFLEVAT